MFSKWRRDSYARNGYANAPQEVLEKLPFETLVNLPVETLVKLPRSLLGKLPPHTLSRLPTDTLARLPNDVLVGLPPEMLARLPSETLARLPHSTLELLPVDRLFDLPDYALSPEILMRIHPGHLEDLSTERLSRLGSLPPGTLECLALSTLSRLPPSVLANLASERLSLLPAEVLSRLPWSTIITLPPETLAGLPMSTLINLPPETLAQLSEEAISQLPLRIQQRVPQEHPHACKPLPPEPYPVTSPRDHQDEYQEQPMQQQQSDTPRENDRVAPNTGNPSKSDVNSTRPQKHASYQYLRRQSREQLRDASQADMRELGPAQGAQPSEIRVTSPLGAVIAEAHGLHRKSFRRRSDSPNHSGPRHLSTQKSSPALSLITPVGTNNEGARTSHSRASTPGLEGGETRIPSSGSHKSTTKHRSARHAPERPTRQYSTNEEQLQQSLIDRERLIVDLQTNLDNETKKATVMEREVDELKSQLERQNRSVDEKELELVDLRNALAKEHSQREQSLMVLSKTQEELSGQKNDLHKRIKELKLDLLAQKSHYDQKLQAQQQKFDVEQVCDREKFEGVAYKYEEQLAKLKTDGVSRIATQEQEMLNKDAEYKAVLQSLEQDHRDRVSDLNKKISKQSAYYEQQLGLLNSRLQGQEVAYATKISQLTESHSHEMRNLSEHHQYEAAQVKDNLNMYIESVRQKYEDQIRADRGHFQRETQTMSENHQRAMHELAVEQSQKVNSLRSEAGDFIRQTSDDNLKGRFRKLKIAVEVVAEPFNLGSVVILPGSGLDTGGFLQREKGMQRHLLRSLVWARIVEGFFSAPFGFGVLGAGTGKQMLVDLFLHWRKLFTAVRQTGDVATGSCPNHRCFLHLSLDVNHG